SADPRYRLIHSSLDRPPLFCKSRAPTLKPHMRKIRANMIEVVAGLFMALATSDASAQTQQSDWHFSLTPYLWLPGFDFTLKYGPPPENEPSANVEGDEDDFLSMLEGAFMISGEARKGPWLV